jgi:chromosome partitioning protein
MIIAVANQKGGVAKTTSTIALGGLLASQGACLAIDFDPQGNLTTGLGIRLTDKKASAYEVIIDDALEARKAIVATKSGINLIPADISLAKGEKELLSVVGNTLVLKEKLEPLREQFSHILIDCPPSLGLLTINALTAADYLLIPVQCQFFALEGLRQLLETVQSVRKRTNPNLKILGVLPTMAERNTVTTQDAIATLNSKFPDLRIFDPVPKSVKFAESNLAREPIHIYSKDKRIVEPYRAVARQLVG